MKAYTPDKVWAVTAFMGTPQFMRFTIEPGEGAPLDARTRNYAFRDEAEQALMLKGFDSSIARQVIEDAIAIMETETHHGSSLDI
jgi:hypothetical protein